MSRRIVLILTVLSLFVASAGLVSCKAGGTSSTKAAPTKKKMSPKELLADKMFILKDGRDMRLAVVQLMNTGIDESQLVKIARDLRFRDFLKYLNSHSAARQVVYVGNSRFRVDGLRYILGEEQFAEAKFYFNVKKFKTQGNMVDAAILEKVFLDGRDFTIYATNKIYSMMLEMELGLGTGQ